MFSVEIWFLSSLLFVAFADGCKRELWEFCHDIPCYTFITFLWPKSEPTWRPSTARRMLSVAGRRREAEVVWTYGDSQPERESGLVLAGAGCRSRLSPGQRSASCDVTVSDLTPTNALIGSSNSDCVPGWGVETDHNVQVMSCESARQRSSAVSWGFITAGIHCITTQKREEETLTICNINQKSTLQICGTTTASECFPNPGFSLTFSLWSNSFISEAQTLGF